MYDFDLVAVVDDFGVVVRAADHDEVALDRDPPGVDADDWSSAWMVTGLGSSWASPLREIRTVSAADLHASSVPSVLRA